jgi:UPF0176 protein
MKTDSIPPFFSIHQAKRPHDGSLVVAAFYCFFNWPDFADHRDAILSRMSGANIKGSLLITNEGFNSTLSGKAQDIDDFLDYLGSQYARKRFDWKESYTDRHPFGKARVRLKKETISCGEPCPPEKIGTYVEPKDWNDLISRPDVVIIDTRNDYEVNLGTFKGAIDPQITSFKQLPDWSRAQIESLKDRPIATFCTGGIRCEKFTAWLKNNGLKEVYHLKGGILQYLEDIPRPNSLWEGECFVFDERIAVDHELQPSKNAKLCLYCDHTLTENDQKSPHYKIGVSCPHCFGESDLRFDQVPSSQKIRKGRTLF